MSVFRPPYPVLALLAGCAALALGGCVIPSPYAETAAEPSSVAVLGVTTADGVRGINRSTAALDLVEALGEGGRRRVVPPVRVRDVLGAERLGELLRRHARSGALDERDRRTLANAALGTRFALVARVESDAVRELEPRYAGVPDAAGRPLPDRTGVQLTTRRETRLSAEIVDLASGESPWRRAYVVTPERRRAHTYYHGSSFSGSVAAMVANKMINGRRRPSHPPAPPLRAALRALFTEVASGLPPP